MKFTYSFLVFCFFASIIPASGQQTTTQQPDYKRLHYLSEEEMLLPVRSNVDFTETPPPIGPVRMVGEFEPAQAVLIRYTFGIPYSLIREMAEDIEVVTLVSSNSQATTVLNLYTNNNINTANCSFLIAPSDSYWTRDYGPWFVFDGLNQPGIVDFPYNRPRPNDNNVPPRVAQHLGINLFGMNVTHTGGNMMSDGLGMAASTELVYEENSQSNSQVNEKMLNYLGVNRYDVMDDPLGDYIKHVDCWGKYLAPDKILLGSVPANDSRYNDFEAVANYFATTNCSYGYPYKVYRVFTPGGNPATPYTNSLILNNKVFVPLTGSQHDNAALAVYQQAMPGYEIVGVTYSGWLDTDALHCRTHEIADIGMLFIDHRPVYGEINNMDSVPVTAKILAHSGQELIADSVRLFYSVNGGEYYQTPLSLAIGNTYSAYIKNYDGNDTIRYFIAAADQSGRSMRHPYMAGLDPHTFTVGTVPLHELYLSADTVLFQFEYEQQFAVYNLTQNDIQIDSLTTDAFFLYPVELPALPVTISPGDSLMVTLELIPGVAAFTPYIYYYDSIIAHSSIGSKTAVLKVNMDLLSSLSEKNGGQILAHPNPFSNKVEFSFDTFTYANQQPAYLRIFNNAGKLIFSNELQILTGENKVIWDGRSNDGAIQSAGMYYYQLKVGENDYNGKLIRSNR